MHSRKPGSSRKPVARVEYPWRWSSFIDAAEAARNFASHDPTVLPLVSAPNAKPSEYAAPLHKHRFAAMVSPPRAEKYLSFGPRSKRFAYCSSMMRFTCDRNREQAPPKNDCAEYKLVLVPRS